MKLQYLKCHGSGNAFFLVDGIEADYVAKIPGITCIFQWMMDEKEGLGADGVLYLSKSDVSAARLVIYNPNGNKARMCLNGIRCAARYLMEKQGHGCGEVLIETDAGNIRVAKEKEQIYGFNGYLVENINDIDFTAENVPININCHMVTEAKLENISPDFLFHAVKVYTPHLIAEAGHIDENTLLKIGREANGNKELFPIGINVSLVKQINRDSIYVRTYERDGIGLSLSCSSAMVAAGCVMVKKGKLDKNRWVNVYNKGGCIKIFCSPAENGKTCDAKLSGPAVFEYTGEIDLGDLNTGGSFTGKDTTKKYKVKNGIINEKEIGQYTVLQHMLRAECEESKFLTERIIE